MGLDEEAPKVLAHVGQLESIWVGHKASKLGVESGGRGEAMSNVGNGPRGPILGVGQPSGE
eukprot:8953967-Lingulodinium_polyedra.AAC.1